MTKLTARIVAVMAKLRNTNKDVAVIIWILANVALLYTVLRMSRWFRITSDAHSAAARDE